jgi:hypothetical protein
MMSMRLLSMMSLIFRCRHHDECRHYDENRHHDESEHNDGRVEPYLSTKVSHTLLTDITVRGGYSRILRLRA